MTPTEATQIRLARREAFAQLQHQAPPPAPPEPEQKRCIWCGHMHSINPDGTLVDGLPCGH